MHTYRFAGGGVWTFVLKPDSAVSNVAVKGRSGRSYGNIKLGDGCKIVACAAPASAVPESEPGADEGEQQTEAKEAKATAKRKSKAKSSKPSKAKGEGKAKDKDKDADKGQANASTAKKRVVKAEDEPQGIDDSDSDMSSIGSDEDD